MTLHELIDQYNALEIELNEEQSPEYIEVNLSGYTYVIDPNKRSQVRTERTRPE